MDRSCASLAALTEDIRACRVCRDAPRYGPPLSHEPRPVFQVSASARLCIAGQAPGVRVHASGRPYTDPSGVRLRGWLGIGEEIFYDPEIVAIAPMGFCFPGLDANGGDLPPRRECAELWRERLMAHLPDLELVLLVGQYAQKWHLGAAAVARGLSETVGKWREVYRSSGPAAPYAPCPILPGATTRGSSAIPGSKRSCCRSCARKWPGSSTPNPPARPPARRSPNLIGARSMSAISGYS